MREPGRMRRWLKWLATRNVARVLPKGAQAVLIARSGLFDSARSGLSDATGSHAAAVRAFVNGAGTGRSANALFDADWYCARYGVAARPAEALVHYLLVGDRMGLQPHPWFDTAYFRQRYSLPRRRGNALAAFLRDWRAHPIGHPLLDAPWYRARYADVAAADVNPLVHYVEHGMDEERYPNAFLDAAWYRGHNPDVAASGMQPALHFCLYGAAELRDPGPEFNAHAYHVRYPSRPRGDGRVFDPLSHYLVEGRDSGAMLESRAIGVEQLCAVRTREPADADRLIDVVIPVYRGLAETRACIESVLNARNACRMRLRLHNDASPEPEVTQYLRWVAQAHPGIVLVENAKNLGFVGTVNDAMRRAMAEADFEAVVLLNSDAEVANDWLDRLGAHAGPAAGRIATVTALSNNATICSFPHFGENRLPEGVGIGQVDALAAAVNAGMAIDVPTGVGFCMLITRAALEQVGLFDEEAFGRGYGEENDFCLRAAAHGYANRLAMDVFVHHVGEVSFADVSKPGKLIAERIIRERYPDYVERIANYCAQDAGLPARLRLVFALWRHGTRPVHALITHALGGGTERHVREVAERLRTQGPVVVLRPSLGNPTRIRVESTAPFDAFDVEVDGLDAERFARLVLTMGVTSVQVHHVLGHGDYLREGLARTGLPFDFIVHDYYTICPQVTLSTDGNRYCGEPPPSGCDACIAARPTHGASDIRNWRHANEWLVLGARQVSAPSRDCSERIGRHFGVLPQVAYHEPDAAGLLRARPRSARRGPRWRVLVLGALAPHKGRALVLAAVESAEHLDLPLGFHLIGDPQGDIPPLLRDRLSWTGRYEDEQLPSLIEASTGDAILFASPIPETYSYTLTAAMRTGLPIVATAIGALPERLREYGDALLVAPEVGGPELARNLVDFLTRATVREPTA